MKFLLTFEDYDETIIYQANRATFVPARGSIVKIPDEEGQVVSYRVEGPATYCFDCDDSLEVTVKVWRVL